MEDKLLDIHEIQFLALKSLSCKIDKNPIFVKSKKQKGPIKVEGSLE
jgi:hypothetical protein